MVSSEVTGSSEASSMYSPEPVYDSQWPVVVGVDGSATSRNAARWAARQATLTKVPLEVFVAYEFPASYGWALSLPDDIDLEAEARSLADEVVLELSQLPVKPKEIVVKVVSGHAASALVEESASASLVVVGSRGLGAFAGMVVGSVSAHLVGHAHCPVVVVSAHKHHRGSEMVGPR